VRTQYSVVMGCQLTGICAEQPRQQGGALAQRLAAALSRHNAIDGAYSRQ